MKNKEVISSLKDSEFLSMYVSRGRGKEGRGKKKKRKKKRESSMGA